MLYTVGTKYIGGSKSVVDTHIKKTTEEIQRDLESMRERLSDDPGMDPGEEKVLELCIY